MRLSIIYLSFFHWWSGARDDRRQGTAAQCRGRRGRHRRGRGPSGRQRSGQGSLRPAPDQRGPRAAREADVVVVQHLRVLDVRRAQRRRLRDGGQPVRPRPGQLAGAHRPAGRHPHRPVLLQSGRQASQRRAFPIRWCAAAIRRARRQHPRHHPRPDRRGLVRHPDLPRLRRTGRRAAQAVLRTDALRRRRAVRLPGPVPARVGQLHPAVDPAGGGLLARDGVDPPVHRLLPVPPSTS